MNIRHQLMTVTLKTPFLYHQAISDVDSEAGEFLKHAHTHFERQEIEKAAGFYRKALAINTKSSELMSNLGTMLLMQGSVSEGIKQLKAAIECNNACTSAYYNLGTFLLSNNTLDAALEHLQSAHNLDQKNVYIKNNLGLVYMHLNKTEKAQEMFEGALAELETFDYAAHNLGCMAYDHNDLVKAIEWFEKAHTMNNKNFATLNNMSCALFLDKQEKRAVSTLYSCIELNQNFPPPYYNLGFMAYKSRLINV